MFANENPYTLRSEIARGITHYYVSFMDGQAIHRETEVSLPVYLEFLRFIQIERSLRHWDERHREHSDLTDETLSRRAANPPISLEETIFDSLQNEHLWTAIQGLPEIQRRRFVLYHEFGLTYEQIAKMEGCTKMPVKRSIDRAELKIREQMKFFKE